MSHCHIDGMKCLSYVVAWRQVHAQSVDWIIQFRIAAGTGQSSRSENWVDILEEMMNAIPEIHPDLQLSINLQHHEQMSNTTEMRPGWKISCDWAPCSLQSIKNVWYEAETWTYTSDYLLTWRWKERMTRDAITTTNNCGSHAIQGHVRDAPTSRSLTSCILSGLS